jgi:hypothetical protein
VPQLVFISREFWKAGHETMLNRMEAEAARICIGLGVPHPFLGIESLTGSKEVWYINGFDSPQGLARAREAYGNNPELTSAMNRFARERSEFASQPSSESLARYQAELSHGTPWTMGTEPFLVIEVTPNSPHAPGTVFESEDGLRFVVIAATSWAEAIATLSNAGPDAKIFTVRPEFSLPAAEWIASDPAFWQSKAHQK